LTQDLISSNFGCLSRLPSVAAIIVVLQLERAPAARPSPNQTETKEATPLRLVLRTIAFLFCLPFSSLIFKLQPFSTSTPGGTVCGAGRGHQSHFTEGTFDLVWLLGVPL
jgi:hypothetical protein